MRPQFQCLRLAHMLKHLRECLGDKLDGQGLTDPLLVQVQPKVVDSCSPWREVLNIVRAYVDFLSVALYGTGFQLKLDDHIGPGVANVEHDVEGKVTIIVDFSRNHGDTLENNTRYRHRLIGPYNPARTGAIERAQGGAMDCASKKDDRSGSVVSWVTLQERTGLNLTNLALAKAMVFLIEVQAAGKPIGINDQAMQSNPVHADIIDHLERHLARDATVAIAI